MTGNNSKTRNVFAKAALTLLIVFTTAPVGAIVPNGNWTDYSADYFSTIDEGNKVITIQNAAELALVARNASSALHWTFKDYTITLAGDINLAEHYWTPIGSSGCYFEGTFDGGNHTISGLTVKSSDTTLGLLGKFITVLSRTLPLPAQASRSVLPITPSISAASPAKTSEERSRTATCSAMSSSQATSAAAVS